MSKKSKTEIKSQEAIAFPVNVDIGKSYIVPCVKNLNGHYIPINSYLHEDKKIIGAAFRHWHIDWRFVSNAYWEAEVGWYVKNTVRRKSNREGGIPISLLENSMMGEYRESTSATDTEIHYKRRKCRRPYAAKNFYEEHKTLPAEWLIKLSEHFCGSKLKQDGDKLICPHKGVLIDKNCIDKNGNYVCPGHMLRFNPKTLKCLKNKKHKQHETIRP